MQTDALLTGVQYGVKLKSAGKLSTVIGLIITNADCRRYEIIHL